uniref:Nucleolar pre-ribosomal-associated protein 1 N-terminal domain-containing protein n=1 Tax=Aegilops tauschii TaxID=37682 RepID=R7WB51_AEGTA
MERLGAASASSGEQTKRVGEPKREQNLVKVGMDTWNQFGASYKIRLVHILKNLHTSEVKIYSDASREFIELLDGDSGGEVLRDYVQQSPRLVELMEAWRLHREKPGMAYILSLFATVLGNPGGKSRQHAFSKKCLDAVARTILEDKDKVGDVYRELNSGEFRRQNAALDLLAAIVRRGAGLASEVAESFDFKMAVVTQLAGIQKKRGGRDGRNQKKGANFGSTRRSLVGFAMSFLEVGNPKLLRWVLQQRELYSGVLRGIGEDDAETVVYVLSTLRDNVLVEESLVPPGLRSVLFGSATLEQLSLISGNLDAGEAADLAHQVLVMVCTDPKNGLMPSSHLRGNEKRLLDLMKKLKSTESVHHKNLLLAIVSKRLSFCAAYMNEFPYNIEPRPSPSWFAAISLAADIISSAKTDSIFHSFLSHDLVSVDDEQVQVVLKCIVPHVCSRAVINRGLQHSDDLVKHGSLRLVFESVNLLCCVTEAINGVVSSVGSTSESSSSTKGKIRMNSFPGLSCSTATDAFLVDKLNQGDQMRVKRWISLREYIQDEVRGAIPDPQVLLKLLSSASQKHQNCSQSRLERRAQVSEPPQKKQRCNAIDEDDDIIIGGIDVEWAKDVSEEQDQDLASDHATTLCEIWGLDKQDLEMKDAEVVDSVFHSKLLDVLRLYLRVMPRSFDGSFDFFRVIPPNPLDLSKDEQHSLLSLLVEYSGQHGGHWDPERVPESMYKHLQPLIDIMLHSPVKIIREQAFILVRAALASSGAFDQNFAEIDAWLVFLPGYEAKWCVRESLGANKLSQIVIPFLCDAVSMVGSNLYKYQDYMRKFISKSGQLEVYSPAFSPLVICVLQKCLRLLDSESGAPQDIICSFPELLDVVKTHCPSHMQFLSSVLYLQHDYLAEIATCWPDIFFCSLRQIEGNLDVDEGKCQNHSISAELTALSTFLNVTPFCALLPSVLSLVFSGPAKTGEAHALLLDALVRLIRAKLYESTISELTFNLRVILFWSHRLLLSYTRKGSNVLEELCHVCSTLVDSIFEHIRVLAADTADLNASVECFQDIVESVLHHPTIDLPCSLSNCPDLTDGSVEHVEEAFTSFSKENLHLVDGFVVNLLSKLYDLLLLAENDELTALSTFLNVTPFCALLPSVLSLVFSGPAKTGEAHALLLDALVRLIRAKLYESTISELTFNLRVILFWSHRLLLSYTRKGSNVLEELCHVCSTLVDSIFEHIRVLAADTADLNASVECFQDIVESVLHHPTIDLPCSLSNCPDLTDGSVEHVEEAFTSFSKENLHLVDGFVVNLLSKLYDLLLLAENDGQSLESLFASPKAMLEKILLLFKDKFQVCMDNGNFGLLLPNFYMVRALKKFMSPVRLLELVNWMFSELESRGSSCSAAFAPAAFVCLSVADIAMELLYDYLQQTDQRSESCQLWGLEIRSSDIATIQRVYHFILHFTAKLNLESADVCLLKMLIRIHNAERSAGQNTEYTAFHMMLSTMATNTPLSILHHCMFPTSKVKAKVLWLLLEVSPIHMNFFGQMLMKVLEEDTSILQGMDYNSDSSWAHADSSILLLPAALSYMRHHSDGHMQCAEFLEPLAKFYCEMLLGDNGFPCWKSFITRTIFEENFGDFQHESVPDMMDYFSDTLLGKSVTMLHYCLSLKEMPRKQRLEIVASLCPQSSGLLDFDVSDINPDSHKGHLKLTNELLAKISLIRLLLSPPRRLSSNETASDRESKRVSNAKLNFISILVRTLDQILRNFPRCDGLSHSDKQQRVVRSLEYTVLKNIIELSSEIQTHLNQLKSIPFLNQFIRSSLLHRRDPADEILELILGHSHFLSSITCSEVSEYSSAFNATGSLLQPAPGILKSVDSLFTKENEFHIGIAETRKIEIIRLLRILYDIKSRQQSNGLLNESKELSFLLLSVYGATLSETDLEIFNLMNEIESHECKTIAEMDHLWGSAAVKYREELKLDSSISEIHKTENTESNSRRRALFRENIPIDSKLCVMTVLQFCYKRSTRTSVFSLEQLRQDKFGDILKTTSQSTDMVRIYDPMFILRFSIHTLLMGYIEPAEFSRVGLLAITLVCISSPDEELRKLGYESLNTFKKSLEASQKSKEKWQLQLLLTYLQNGISKPWQRIPSIIAIFAAEASLTLLDSSHTQFNTISKYLMNSASVDMQSIPLFPTLLKSSSVHFKADRLWMLRLLYAGSNLADDATICKNKSVLELALAFCSSAISDSESKHLILQVLKKCVKLPVLAQHLVKNCGLLSWISSVISTHGKGLDNNSSSRIVGLALEKQQFRPPLFGLQIPENHFAMDS